jgi:hypothetical protein
MKGKKAVLIVCLVFFLLGGGAAAAQVSPGFDARWSRAAAGGGERHSPAFLLQDMTGQWVMGNNSASNLFQAVPDFFWSGDEVVDVKLFLPLVVR